MLREKRGRFSQIDFPTEWLGSLVREEAAKVSWGVFGEIDFWEVVRWLDEYGL